MARTAPAVPIYDQVVAVRDQAAAEQATLSHEIAALDAELAAKKDEHTKVSHLLVGLDNLVTPA